MEKVLVEYLKYLNIPISERYCKKIVSSHADYPSLLSIADGLNILGIEHEIGRIDGDHLKEVPFPYVIITELNQPEPYLIKNLKTLEELKLGSVLDSWRGLVLKVEVNNSIKNEENNRQLKIDQFIKRVVVSSVLAAVGLITISVIQSFSLFNAALISSIISGLILGYVLFAKEIGIKYKVVETFCNSSTKLNCDRILNSEEAKLFGLFSLSEVVFSYFIFQVSVFVFSTLYAPSVYIWPLVFGALLTIPVAIFSLYYQYVVAKTWCRLCLAVNAILGIQLLIFALGYVNNQILLSNIQVVAFLNSLGIFILATTIVALFKYISVERVEGLSNETKSNRVKYNTDVFTYLLSKGKRIDIGQFEKEITLGAVDSPTHLLLILNLHCYPCKLAFNSVVELLNSYPDSLRVSVRFIFSGDNRVKGMPISTYLIRYWETKIFGKSNAPNKTQKLLEDWFSSMDPNLFIARHKIEVPEEVEIIQGIELDHYKWTTKNRISQTPSFFLNGYPLPRDYSINDLSMLLPGLISYVQGAGTLSEISA